MSGAVSRLLIVDDHELVAVAIAELLGDQPEFEVIGVVGTLAAARDAAIATRPDVVLADQRLPDGSGVELAEQLRAVLPDTAVVILTAEPTPAVVEAALESGCAGVIGKDAPLQELLGALRAASRGGTHFSRGALNEVMAQRRQADHTERLSDREREVLQLIADGHSTRHIAEQLHLSQHTVRNHLRRALTRLDSHSKLDAVIIAANRGEIRLDRDPRS